MIKRGMLENDKNIYNILIRHYDNVPDFEYDWSDVDKIIYINLDRRQDRNVKIEEQLARAKIPANKVIRFSAICHEYPNSGCNLSHSAVLKMAYDSDCQNVLILEDDIKYVWLAIKSFFIKKLD